MTATPAAPSPPGPHLPIPRCGRAASAPSTWPTKRATAARVFASLDAHERDQLASLLGRLCAGGRRRGGER